LSLWQKKGAQDGECKETDLVVAKHVDPDEGDQALEGDPVGRGHNREVDGGGGQHEAVARLQRRPQLGLALRQHVPLTLHYGHGCVEEDDDGRRGDQLVHDGLPDDGLDGGAREDPVQEAVPVPEHVGEDQVPCYPEPYKAAPVIRLLLPLGL